jgi:hypothetical protein
MNREGAWFLAWIGRIAVLGLLVCLLTGSASLADGVTPTNEWINVYSTNSTLAGQTLPVGSSVAVFDEQGTRCGEFEVTTEGWYGLMACYRDEPMTPEDEGAAVGDALRFTVNGRTAHATAVSLNGTAVPPSTRVRWTANGDRWEVDLQGLSESQVIGGYSLPARRPAPAWPWIVPLIGLAILSLLVAVTIGKRHRAEASRSRR